MGSCNGFNKMVVCQPRADFLLSRVSFDLNAQSCSLQTAAGDLFIYEVLLVSLKPYLRQYLLA